jgi:hypothetical protein
MVGANPVSIRLPVLSVTDWLLETVTVGASPVRISDPVLRVILVPTVIVGAKPVSEREPVFNVTDWLFVATTVGAYPVKTRVPKARVIELLPPLGAVYASNRLIYQSSHSLLLPYLSKVTVKCNCEDN